MSVDNAMKWGFNWELGPFETWDALGVESVARRLEKEGRAVPATGPRGSFDCDQDLLRADGREGHLL